MSGKTPPPGGGSTISTDSSENKDLMEFEQNKSEVGENSQTQIKETYYFTEKDVGPFRVMVESKNKERNVGNYHHLAIAKNILDLKLENVKKIERKGINKISVEFKNYQAANQFAKNEIMSKDYNLFIPYNLLSCKGVVKYIDKDLNEEALKEITGGSEFGINIQVLNAKRLKRRVSHPNGTVTYELTGSVLYTFAGKLHPKFVKIYGVEMPVEPYIAPVVQCFQCLLYGHTKRQCRGKVRCQNCTGRHEGNCESETRCLHCRNSEHKSISRQCPEFKRQKQLRELMCFQNLSFYDAGLLLPKPKIRKTFYPQPEEFPKLPRQKGVVEDTYLIPIEKRQEYAVSKRTYATQVTENPRESPKRIKDNSGKPGYDRRMHEACLMSPNLTYKPYREQMSGEVRMEGIERIETSERKFDLKDTFEEIKKAINEADNQQKIEYFGILNNLLKIVTSDMIPNASSQRK